MNRDIAMPWGLTRMESYPTVAGATATPVGLDPDAQTAIYQDAAGRRLEMGRHSTHRCVETKTRTSQGDGNGPSNSDEGHDQRTEQDEVEG